MESSYETTVRSVAAPQFEERESPAEIAWERDGSVIRFTMTWPDSGRSGTLEISGRGVSDPEDDGVFARANEIEELDASDQELVIRCWNPDPGVMDGANRYHIPLSDELYGALEDVLRDSDGVAVG